MCMYLSEKALFRSFRWTGFCQTFCCRHYIILIVRAMNLQDIYECNHLITLALYQLEFSNFDLMIDI